MRIPTGNTRAGAAARQAAALSAVLWLAAMPAAAVEPDASLPATADGQEQVAGIGTPVDSDHLDSLRGGEGAGNWIEVGGEVGGNSAENIVSGDNLVDGGSFGNSAGVSTVIQNSGSNVLIQNAMIINVEFADPPP